MAIKMYENDKHSKQEKVMKDCIFQYALGNGIMNVDTDLITRPEAEKLWEEYKPMFMTDLERGDDPEMAVWIGMADDGDFHTTSLYWVGGDMIIHDGQMYQRV